MGIKVNQTSSFPFECSIVRLDSVGLNSRLTKPAGELAGRGMCRLRCNHSRRRPQSHAKLCARFLDGLGALVVDNVSRWHKITGLNWTKQRGTTRGVRASRDADKHNCEFVSDPRIRTCYFRAIEVEFGVLVVVVDVVVVAQMCVARNVSQCSSIEWKS